jgi:hypothetical protein
MSFRIAILTHISKPQKRTGWYNSGLCSVSYMIPKLQAQRRFRSTKTSVAEAESAVNTLQMGRNTLRGCKRQLGRTDLEGAPFVCPTLRSRSTNIYSQLM